MYLKSLSIKNYRKYGKDFQTINFAHSKWPKKSNNKDAKTKINKTEEYISKNSSLIVGKNNSGKSTIVKLLTTLQNTKAGSRNVFKYTDFNLDILAEWYQTNINKKSKKEIRSIDQSKFPKLEFQLVLGIDDGNDLISSFEDILILSGIKTIKTQETKKTRKTRKTDEISEVTINVKYEVTDAQSFSEELVNLKTTYSERADQQNKEFSNYRKELQYRQYLALFSSNYFILNFYPKGRDEPAKEFSLASLLKVDTYRSKYG